MSFNLGLVYFAMNIKLCLFYHLIHLILYHIIVLSSWKLLSYKLSGFILFILTH